MFFHQPSGIIAIAKVENFLSLLIPKLIIILIIKKLCIIPSISRIIVINIPGFFIFDRIHPVQSLPLWFEYWWKLFGAETGILPPHLCNKFLDYSKTHPSPSPFNRFPPELYFFLHFNIPWIMSWDCNFFSPEDNVYNPQSPNENIRYVVRTTTVKWWDKFTYDDIITKITKLCTDQFLASNQFLVKKSINQAKLASSSSKHEFKKICSKLYLNYQMMKMKMNRY
jgi:hypothetical protein